MVYNKLVRDRIPELMERQGKRPVTRLLEPEEYTRALEEKLREETEEYFRDQNAEELADILEVVFALGKNLGCSQETLLRLRREKAQARGAFRDRVYLICDGADEQF